MPTALSQLPAPPKGQTGITLSSLKNLPPPPQGQTGLTLAQLQEHVLPKTSSAPSFASRVSSDISTAGSTIQSQIAGEGKYANETPVRRGTEAGATAANAVLQTASEALPSPVRSAIDAGMGAISKGFNFLTDKLASTKLFSDIGNLEAQGYINPKDNPELYKLKEVLGTVSAQGQVAGDIVAADQIANAAQQGVNLSKQGAQAVQAKLSTMADTSAEASQQSAIKAAGQIVQGKTGQAATSAGVLKNIDATGVKTYEDLSNAVQTHINDLKSIVDAEYEANPTPIKLDDLTQTLKSGDVTAQANYVKDALTQLKELYTKTNDPLSAAKIDALTAKASDEGLTPSEINQLARTYGTEFSDKAFSKTGDPLTSVNAQAFENTRSGIKDTARSLLKDDTAKIADESMGNAIETKKLIDKMNEKVNALTERIQQRGIIEKFSRLLGKGVDMATFGGPRAFIQKWLFPSNVGLKTLNSLDLQDLIKTNLKKIQALETSPEDTLPGKLLHLVNDSQSTK